RVPVDELCSASRGERQPRGGKVGRRIAGSGVAEVDHPGELVAGGEQIQRVWVAVQPQGRTTVGGGGDQLVELVQQIGCTGERGGLQPGAQHRGPLGQRYPAHWVRGRIGVSSLVQRGEEAG